ncbi:MAG: hypothetical protein U9Q03_02670 [Patescibacteria group bacterium]|nr:hypothetical protein [Patescibacteria group bacterium]
MPEFRHILNDSEAKRTVREIMKKIGFGNEPDWYVGGSAFLVRTTAADRLNDIIQKHWKESDDIAHPHPKIIAAVQGVAKTEPDNTVAGTYAATRIAIFGHIWLRRIQRIKPQAFVNNQAAPAVCAMIAQAASQGGTGPRMPRKSGLDRGRFGFPGKVR